MPKTNAERTRSGVVAGWVGIICNILLSVGKLAAGALSGSAAVTADALNNLTDASSSIISLVGFRLSEKRADEEHPCGHARYEYISGFAVAILVIIVGAELLRSGIERIITPVPVDFSAVSVAVMGVSIAVKLAMALYDGIVGRRIDSVTLLAAAVDSRNDCIVTACVLAAGFVSHCTGAELDGAVTVAVAVFVLCSGIEPVRSTISLLLGKSLPPKAAEEIRRKLLSYPGVMGAHDLIVHDYGHGRMFATVHVEMSAEDDVIKSHDTIDRIERDFSESGMNLLIHFDPVAADDTADGELRCELERIVRLIDERLSVHDLRVERSGSAAKAYFDVVAPKELGIDEASLCSEISRFAAQKYPDLTCEITLDGSFIDILGL